MLTAHLIKKGSFIRHGDKICKVMDHDYHMGGGRAGGMVHMRLKDMSNGHVSEVKLDPHDKVEDISVERRKMKYLYTDKDGLWFMDQESFEQLPIGKAAIGNLAMYIKEEMAVDVEFYEGNPIHVNAPESIALQVLSTAEPTKGGGDSTFKEATLEGDARVLVPHFIKAGDKIYVNVESGKYIDRVKE